MNGTRPLLIFVWMLILFQIFLMINDYYFISLGVMFFGILASFIGIDLDNQFAKLGENEQ